MPWVPDVTVEGVDEVVWVDVDVPDEVEVGVYVMGKLDAVGDDDADVVEAGLLTQVKRLAY